MASMLTAWWPSPCDPWRPVRNMLCLFHCSTSTSEDHVSAKTALVVSQWHYKLERCCFVLLLFVLLVCLFYNVHTGSFSRIKYLPGRCLFISQDWTPELHWSKTEISFLLSSYFYGSFFTQIPAGSLSDIFGGKHILTAAMLVSAICSLLTPVCARADIAWVFVLRVVIGLAGVSRHKTLKRKIVQGVTWPEDWPVRKKRSLRRRLLYRFFILPCLYLSETYLNIQMLLVATDHLTEVLVYNYYYFRHKPKASFGRRYKVWSMCQLIPGTVQ